MAPRPATGFAISRGFGRVAPSSPRLEQFAPSGLRRLAVRRRKVHVNASSIHAAPPATLELRAGSTPWRNSSGINRSSKGSLLPGWRRPSLCPQALGNQQRRCLHVSAASTASAAPPAKPDYRSILHSTYGIPRFTIHPLDPTKLEVLVPKLSDEPGYWDASWLRLQCPCASCQSPFSGNKNIGPADIPANIKFRKVSYDEHIGDLHVEWEGDVATEAGSVHTSTYSAASLKSWLAGIKPKRILASLRFQHRVLWDEYWTNMVTRKPWDAEQISRDLRVIEYEDWMRGKHEHWLGVLELERSGLVLVRNVPQTEKAVEDLTARLGPIKETFYGRSWDVISKPQAENVAYTDANLALHSDMLYLESPPRIQVLHCLENSASGGTSLFSDAFRTVLEATHFQPALAKALEGWPLAYHYRANGNWYSQERAVVERSKKGDIFNLWWSPPFLSALRMPANPKEHRRFRDWLYAARYFHHTIHEPQNMYRHRLQPGEALLFDNRRVLHGREAFSQSSGRRHLRGAYVSDEDFRSRLRAAPAKAVAEFGEHVSFTETMDGVVKRYGRADAQDPAGPAQLARPCPFSELDMQRHRNPPPSFWDWVDLRQAGPQRAGPSSVKIIRVQNGPSSEKQRGRPADFQHLASSGGSGRMEPQDEEYAGPPIDYEELVKRR